MKKAFKLFSLLLTLAMIFPLTALASENNYRTNNLIGAEQSEFEQVIAKIQSIKTRHPEYIEETVLEIMDEQYKGHGRGIVDIWNALTDLEKKLCIRYPFNALKVNTAKNIAISQTEAKFGSIGLEN